MGKSRSTGGGSNNINWDALPDSLKELCEATGYELGEDDYGNISIYDKEYDTEIILNSSFMEVLPDYEEVHQGLLGSRADFLKEIIKSYHSMPPILKRANQFLMFDEYSKHSVFKDNNWDALHVGTNIAHGILISDHVLGSQTYTNPIRMVMAHEMGHGLDCCIRDDFGRRNGASQQLINLVDKYGSATAYSKDNFGRGFGSEAAKYREDFAETIGIVSAYQINPNFKVEDANGMVVSASKWMENHKELASWAEDYIKGVSSEDLDIPSHVMDASWFDGV